MKYLIVVEKTETGFSSYSPDLLGCVATGATEEETEANMKEAIAFHVEGLKQEGFPIPQPSAKSAYIEVAA
ncbi:MAG: type II toxin-antitoxin system HicB family antitoxin [Gemmatimonadetes bacterium]|nr:type II toxin-antitoxin system HicB family antitoxin [Gemmatimonadota bacterium]MDE2737467.1 type II toxin-antitoxin system HicB family antitoxin [Gemmatimonadota bacterium]